LTACPHPNPPPPAGEGVNGARPVISSNRRLEVLRARLRKTPSPASGGGLGWGYIGTYSAANAALGWKEGSAARSLRAIGCGHQRSSHSEKTSLSCGMTFSAKSWVL